MPSPEKFRETLDEFKVDQAVIDEMYQGYEKLTSKTPKVLRAAFFSQALNVMNARLPRERVQEIFEANACCKSGARERNSKEFARINAALSTEERLVLISQRPYYNMGSARVDEQGYLVVNAVAYHPADRYECACPTVSKVNKTAEISRNYCYCCGGHFKYHYQIMLNRKLELVEIVSSPHEKQGALPCVFKFAFI